MLATFVTLALAAGRSEAWVSEGPGRRSSVMIQGYRRAARTAAELELGQLAPMADAVSWTENRRVQPTVFSATNPPPRKRRASEVGSETVWKWPLGGMADTGDLKSLARKSIPVRVREGPPEPIRGSPHRSSWGERLARYELACCRLGVSTNSCRASASYSARSSVDSALGVSLNARNSLGNVLQFHHRARIREQFAAHRLLASNQD